MHGIFPLGTYQRFSRPKGYWNIAAGRGQIQKAQSIVCGLFGGDVAEAGGDGLQLDTRGTDCE
ncbi:hypothetical protein D3C75_1110360 [compost metagenome]